MNGKLLIRFFIFPNNTVFLVALSFTIIVALLFLALNRSAELLGLDSTQLTEALTQRSMILRGEEILTPLNIQQVKSNYFRMFVYSI